MKDELIRNSVRNNQANLRLGFIEASEKLTLEGVPTTAKQVKDYWYKRLKHTNIIVFVTPFRKTEKINTKNYYQAYVIAEQLKRTNHE